MPITFTTPANGVPPKQIHAGENVVTIDYTTPTGNNNSMGVSNVGTIVGPKIPNRAVITSIYGRHSSGAASCPVDIGYDTSVSAFASAKAQGTTSSATDTQVLPFRVSVSDAGDQFVTLKFTATPSSDTVGVRFQYTIKYSMDQNSL